VSQFADIVARVEEVRVALRLGRARFAKEIGLQPQTYSNFVGKQKSKPSVALLRGIVKAFNVDARWLLTGEGTPFAGEGGFNLWKEADPVFSDEPGAYFAQREWTPSEINRIQSELVRLTVLAEKVENELGRLHSAESSALQKCTTVLTRTFAANPKLTTSHLQQMLKQIISEKRTSSVSAAFKPRT
jgi:transcriptional regulator with XRE-family HTH domain